MIIVAGGSGTRMGAHLPKQFLELKGLPVLMHTVRNLHRIDSSMQLVIVLPKEQIDLWKTLCATHEFDVSHSVAPGGATRFLSVKSGLQHVTGRLTGIHDGVRPFVSAAVVDACFAEADTSGAAIPVIPVVQSLRQIEGQTSRAVDRDAYRVVQTPQCFRTEILKEAFSRATKVDYSDDASVVEAHGQHISLVSGNSENIKITSPIDLDLAHLLMERHN